MFRVLIVDDSPVVREILQEWLASEKDIEVVGEAENGGSAVDLVKKLSPDLVIMDILMPGIDGLEATEIIMADHPTPILIFSSVANDQEANIAFEAISRGALDVMAKPDSVRQNHQSIKEELIKKIRILSRIPVIRHPRGRITARARKQEMKIISPLQVRYEVLGIGASTGGPRALHEILQHFPKNFPSPILVVQHIAKAFIEGLVNWINKDSELSVKIAKQGEKLKPATVYLAPPDLHLLVRNDRIHLKDTPPVNNCRPSVDVLFQSLAESYGERAVAVLLTGMGNDGAVGMKEIYERGGKTIAQDQETSLVFGMPASAIEMSVVDKVLPLGRIPEEILNAFSLLKKGGR